MPAYVIVDVNTGRPAEYERYKEMAQETVTQFGGRYLVRALAWWHSDEYAPAKALRQRLSTTEMLLVDGYDEAV